MDIGGKNFFSSNFMYQKRAGRNVKIFSSQIDK